MSIFARWPIGTRIAASRAFGPAIAGQLGVITGYAGRSPRPWWGRRYCCTFLGDLRVVARVADIVVHDHGCTKAMLEDPLWFIHRDAAVCPYSHAWDILRGPRRFTPRPNMPPSTRGEPHQV